MEIHSCCEFSKVDKGILHHLEGTGKYRMCVSSHEGHIGVSFMDMFFSSMHPNELRCFMVVVVVLMLLNKTKS